MASVLETKEALATEQTKAIALSEKAFQAIDSITNVGNFWLTFLAIELAVLALIGLAVVFLGAKRQARKVAEERIKNYMSSDEGNDMVRSAIADEVTTQLERRSFVVVHPLRPETEDSHFPKDPHQNKGGGP